MKEHAPKHHQPESLIKPEEHLMLPTAEQAEPLRPGEKDPVEAIIEARQDVAEIKSDDNKTEDPLERLAEAEKAEQPATPTHINRELKQVTLQRELQHIRRELPAPQRVLSKVIHQPLVRAVSETASKTVSRPSGLLGGGLVAFLGTTGYLYLAKHVGFKYNSFICLLLFVGGFVLGVVLELFVHLATKSRHTAD